MATVMCEYPAEARLPADVYNDHIMEFGFDTIDRKRVHTYFGVLLNSCSDITKADVLEFFTTNPEPVSAVQYHRQDWKAEIKRQALIRCGWEKPENEEEKSWVYDYEPQTFDKII